MTVSNPRHELPPAVNQAYQSNTDDFKAADLELDPTKGTRMDRTGLENKCDLFTTAETRLLEEWLTVKLIAAALQQHGANQGGPADGREATSSEGASSLGLGGRSSKFGFGDARRRCLEL